MITEQAETIPVTKETVLEAIKAFSIETFTTFEIAEAMGVEEYPVRAAVSWLIKGKLIEKAGARKLWTKPVRRERRGFVPGKCEPYWATTYQLKIQTTADFMALNRVFGFGR